MPTHAILSGTTVPVAQLGTGTPDNTKYLAGDGVWTVMPTGGVTDHGALTGLADDDHTQYHTDARGDARYSVLGHTHAGVYQPLATVLTNTTAAFTTAQETKLSGIAAGAEVNVNADWTSGAGDSQILNKPTLGDAAAKNTGTTAGTVAAGDHTHTGIYQPLATVLTNTTAAFTTAQETKLSGIETGATADQTGAEIVTAIDTALGSTTWQGGGGGSDPSYTSGSFTVATNTSRIQGPTLIMTTTQQIVVQGTGRLRVYN